MPVPADFYLNNIADAKFHDSPLEAGWVLEGDPHPKSAEFAASPDGLFTVGMWECSAGRFKFYYYTDETVHILEGGSIVKMPDGKTRALKPGDVVYFPQGLTTEWTVPDHIRKIAVFRAREQSLASRIWHKIKSFF